MVEKFCMGDQTYQKCYIHWQAKYMSQLPISLYAWGDFFHDSTFYTQRKGWDNCQLIYTLDGAGRFKYDGQEFTLHPGQLILIDCRKFHYYATQGVFWHSLWVHLDGKCIFDYADLLNGNGGVPITPGPQFDFPKLHQKILCLAHRHDPMRDLALSTFLVNMLTDLIQHKAETASPAPYHRHQDILETSLQYIQDHFREPLSVEQLAAFCHLSKYYYSKMFKAYTGVTPYDYLLDIRIQYSQQLLLNTTATIEEIAHEIGFADSANFIVCFKKRTSMTPLQFRKQQVPMK